MPKPAFRKRKKIQVNLSSFATTTSVLHISNKATLNNRERQKNIAVRYAKRAAARRGVDPTTLIGAKTWSALLGDAKSVVKLERKTKPSPRIPGSHQSRICRNTRKKPVNLEIIGGAKFGKVKRSQVSNLSKVESRHLKRNVKRKNHTSSLHHSDNRWKEKENGISVQQKKKNLHRQRETKTAISLPRETKTAISLPRETKNAINIANAAAKKKDFNRIETKESVVHRKKKEKNIPCGVDTFHVINPSFEVPVDRLRESRGASATKRKLRLRQTPAARRMYDTKKLLLLHNRAEDARRKVAVLMKKQEELKKHSDRSAQCEKQGAVLSRHRNWLASSPLKKDDIVKVYSTSHIKDRTTIGKVIDVFSAGKYTIAWSDGRVSRGTKREDLELVLNPPNDLNFKNHNVKSERKNDEFDDLFTLRTQYEEQTMHAKEHMERLRDSQSRRENKKKRKDMTKWLENPWTVRGKDSYERQEERWQSVFRLFENELHAAKEKRRTQKYELLKQFAKHHNYKKKSVYTPDRGQLSITGIW
eukprot:g4794.t1